VLYERDKLIFTFIKVREYKNKENILKFEKNGKFIIKFYQNRNEAYSKIRRPNS